MMFGDVLSKLIKGNLIFVSLLVANCRAPDLDNSVDKVETLADKVTNLLNSVSRRF